MEILIFIIIICCALIMPRVLICAVAISYFGFEVGTIPIILIAIYLDVYYLMLQKNKDINLIK